MRNLIPLHLLLPVSISTSVFCSTIRLNKEGGIHRLVFCMQVHLAWEHRLCCLCEKNCRPWRLELYLKKKKKRKAELLLLRLLSSHSECDIVYVAFLLDLRQRFSSAVSTELCVPIYNTNKANDFLISISFTLTLNMSHWKCVKVYEENCSVLIIHSQGCRR